MNARSKQLPLATGTVAPEPFYERTWVRLSLAAMAVLRLAQTHPVLASVAAVLMTVFFAVKHWDR